MLVRMRSSGRIILSARAAHRSAHRRRSVSGSDLRRPAAHAKKRRGAANQAVRGDDRRRRADHGHRRLSSRASDRGRQRPQRGGGARPARRQGPRRQREAAVRSARRHGVAVDEARPQLRHLQRRQRSAGGAAAGRDRTPARETCPPGVRPAPLRTLDAHRRAAARARRDDLVGLRLEPVAARRGRVPRARRRRRFHLRQRSRSGDVRAHDGGRPRLSASGGVRRGTRSSSWGRRAAAGSPAVEPAIDVVGAGAAGPRRGYHRRRRRLQRRLPLRLARRAAAARVPAPRQLRRRAIDAGSRGRRRPANTAPT